MWWFAPLAAKGASRQVPATLYAHFIPWLQAAGLAWLGGAILSIWLARREQVIAAVSVMAIAGLLMGQAVLLGYNALSPASSAYLIAQQIKPYLKPGVPFYSVAMYEQTLPPYIQRTMTLVAHPDEMEFGIQQEPNKWIPDVASFTRIWRQQPYALAIMSPAYYQKFTAEGLPMQVIASDTRRVVVIEPANLKSVTINKKSGTSMSEH